MAIRSNTLGVFHPSSFGCLLLVALWGCGTSPVEPHHHAPAEPLEGTWRWVSSVDVSTQQVHTPASEGFDAELVFSLDSELEGSFVYRRGGGTETSGRFSISFEDAPGNDFIALDHQIDFLERHAWLTVGADTLRLGGRMESGYDSRYVRVP